MSDTSFELNYSPLPLSPAPSEVLEEDPYEACSDEEDNDDEDDSMKFPEMGATWEPVVNAFAGSSHQEACDRMEDWADENGYVLSRRGDKNKGQAYFYCAKVGRQKQHNRNAAQSGVLPEDSRTVPTYAPESKEDCCPFNVYISRRKDGMREVWSVSHKGLRLDHNHPPQTAKQKKFLGPVNLSREDADLIMNLGQAFMPPRNVVHFMRNRGVEITAKQVQNIYDAKGYSSALDAHELVNRLEEKGEHGWYTHVVKDDIGKLSHVFWMSVEQIAIARRFPYLILHDNTYQSNRYNLNIGLFVGVNNYGQSVLMGQAIVVDEKTRDFEYQFTHWLAAVGIAPVVMFTDACVKASGAVATVFPNAKHFWCYWHIAKNVAKNLKGVLGHDTFTKLVRLMARAHRQVSIVVFEHMWNVEILGDPIFSSGHTYLSATWGGDKVRRWARCFQVGVFTRGIVSTQRVEGIHRWTKEGRLTKRKKLNDVFDALMVIVGELILKWERLDTRVTTGSFRSRHETAQQIFPMPYEAMKDRLTTWGRDEAAHQMLLSFGYDMKRLPDHAYEALAPPTLDNCPDPTKGVEDLLEYDLPPRMVTPAPNAAIFEVSRQGTIVAHYIQLSGPVRTSVGSTTYTLYRDLVCTCAFPTMLGMPCRHFWRVLRDDAFAAFHLGLVHSQYFLEEPPMHEELELMSRNVVGKLYQNHERVGPCPVEAPSVEGIVPEGEGEAALLVRQGEVQRIRNRFQLSALAREFVDVAIVSQERFEDARFTLRTWINTQRKPLGDLKADNPAKPPTKAQKRKASEMATGGKKKKKNTAEPSPRPKNRARTRFSQRKPVHEHIFSKTG